MARRQSRMRPWHAVGIAALAVAGVASLFALATAVLAVIFARTVITPPTRREEDVKILDVGDGSITLSKTLDSLTPGRYSLWFLGDSGHARIGEILQVNVDSVVRQLTAVDRGDVRAARQARMGGWYYLSPAELGFPFEDVTISTEFGDAPAWLIPADESSGDWMISVHGRAVQRQETIRAVPVFRSAGYNCLLVSYRNDGDAPSSPDNRYSLGDTEWRDVDAAMRFAVERGARRIVLMGWSMGGATVLQAATRSPLGAMVSGLVLESPVVDWVSTLDYQGRKYYLPRVVRATVLSILSGRWSHVLTGQRDPIDLKRLDLVSRASELRWPTLILHSDDDGYVPSDASRALARLRPDVVTLDAFTTARHTKLWNYGPDRWESTIRSWLAANV